jgi:hypothetical protein
VTTLENLYAFIDEHGTVIGVYVFENPNEELLVQIQDSLSAASVKSCYEFGYASNGDEFYNNKFYSPKPYNSWVRNEELGIWEAPIPEPEKGSENGVFVWDEDVLDWVFTEL